MLLDPVFDQLAVMNTQIIKNQIDLFTSILDQPLAKLDKGLPIHCTIIYHETNRTLVCNRGDQVDPLMLGIEPYDQGLPLWCVASSMLAISAKSCFVTPMNPGRFFSGLSDNGRILFSSNHLCTCAGFCS